MDHDEVITELWRVKDEIAAECKYDVYALIDLLREEEQRCQRMLARAADVEHPDSPRP